MERRYAILVALAFECVGLVTAAVLIGRYCDTTYGWRGMGAAGGAIIGVFGWVFHLVMVLKKISDDDDKADSGPQ